MIDEEKRVEFVKEFVALEDERKLIGPVTERA